MDDVGLPELRQARYVVTRIGDVDVEEMKLGEAHVPEDAPTLPQEMPLSEDGTGHLSHCDRLCLLIAHQHLGLNSIVVKSIHQTVGCYCGATGLLACIYYEYSHRLLVLIFDCMLARLDTAGRMQSYTCAKIMLFGENTKQKTLQMISVTKNTLQLSTSCSVSLCLTFKFLIQRQSHDPLCYLLNNLP